MSYIKFSQGGKLNYNIEKWVCDNIEDLKKINCRNFGSTAYVIDMQTYYILNGAGV